MQQYPPPDPHLYPPPYAAPTVPSAGAMASARPQRRGGSYFLMALGVLILGLGGALFLLLLGLVWLYSSDEVLPNVQVAEIEVGGLSEAQAAERLTAQWNGGGILLRDGQRSWSAQPADFGLNLDAVSTARAAQDVGRGNGGPLLGLEALLVGYELDPQMNIDLNQTAAKLEEVRPLVEEPARNAGVQWVNGSVQATPPVQGRALDIQATLLKLQTDPAAELADGALDLVMFTVAPAVTDATPLLAEAQALLSQNLSIEAYDPVSNESQMWTLTPDQWGAWLLATPTDSGGLSFALDQAALGEYLNLQNSGLGFPKYIKVEEGLQGINAALAQKNLSAWLRVYHQPSSYTVQAGDSLASIGYDLGIPYPWIQAANPGIGALNPGQQLSIPSKDDLLPLPIVKHKRIVVSIPQQEMWAYENGQLLWNWRVSTGISRSPTSPGIFQIQSHEVNAYGGQWNLYMPHFMGVYRPGPGVEVMNGFHGFPTDAAGGYLLWTNDLGRPATYGCILLSLENARALYEWAEEGVVVEIQG